MEYWKNHKTGTQEKITDLNPRQLSYKLNLIGSRINSHQSKIENLKSIRRILLDEIVRKGRKPERLEELGKRFIIVQDDGTPVVVTLEILHGNDLEPSKMMKLGRLVILPEVAIDEEL